MTNVNITLHLNVADDEPGVPATEESMREWLIPDLLQAIGKVIGHPGDYGAVWDGDPRFPEYTVEVVEV